MLKINNIYKSYEQNVVLKDVSFSIIPGKITSLIGRNGSGKTTCLEIISRIINFDSGSIYIDDREIENNIELQEEISFLPDKFDFFKFSNAKTIMEYYEIVYPKFDKDFAINELKKMRIDLKKNVNHLSKGMTTILGLIIILATNSKYILLDEVLDGIDILNKRKILEYILYAAEDGRGILISSHSLSELESISDMAIYITLDGSVSEVDENVKLKKYQIVTDSILSDNDRKNLFIISEIGRVTTILCEDNFYKILNSIDTKVIQYDEIPIKYEDIFYLEGAKEEQNERNK